MEKEKEKALREKEKAEEEKRKKEEAALLKPVQVQKVPPGVDPKTLLCAYFNVADVRSEDAVHVLAKGRSRSQSN